MARTGTPPREKARVYRTGRPDRLSPVSYTHLDVYKRQVLIEGVTEGNTAGLMALFADVDRISKVGPVGPGRDLFLQAALPLYSCIVPVPPRQPLPGMPGLPLLLARRLGAVLGLSLIHI